MINYQTITIDLQPDYREPVVQMYLSERDVGRPIQVNVLMQGQPYSFTAGTTVHIDLRKPSGKTVQVDGNYAVGSNVVLFNVVEQMAAEPGMCLTELSIVGDGQDPIGSKNWLTKVELSPMHAGDPSETWIEDLDELVQDAMEGHIDATLSIEGDAADAKAAGDAIAAAVERIPAVDDTLTVSGAAADAAATGTEISDLKSAMSQVVNLPISGGAPDYGTPGQMLKTNGDGSTQWTSVTAPTKEQVQEAVTNWLDDHPEATTTVEDGSITEQKLSAALQKSAINPFVTPQQFGAVGDGSTDDTAAFTAFWAATGAKFVPAGQYLINGVVRTYARGVYGNGKWDNSLLPAYNVWYPNGANPASSVLFNSGEKNLSDNEMPTAVLQEVVHYEDADPTPNENFTRTTGLLYTGTYEGYSANTSEAITQNFAGIQSIIRNNFGGIIGTSAIQGRLYIPAANAAIQQYGGNKGVAVGGGTFTELHCSHGGYAYGAEFDCYDKCNEGTFPTYQPGDTLYDANSPRVTASLALSVSGKTQPATACLITNGAGNTGAWYGIYLGGSTFGMNGQYGVDGTVGINFAGWRKNGKYAHTAIRFGYANRHIVARDGLKVAADSTIFTPINNTANNALAVLADTAHIPSFVLGTGNTGIASEDITYNERFRILYSDAAYHAQLRSYGHIVMWCGWRPGASGSNIIGYIAQQTAFRPTALNYPSLGESAHPFGTAYIGGVDFTGGNNRIHADGQVYIDAPGITVGNSADAETLVRLLNTSSNTTRLSFGHDAVVGDTPSVTNYVENGYIEYSPGGKQLQFASTAALYFRVNKDTQGSLQGYVLNGSQFRPAHTTKPSFGDSTRRWGTAYFDTLNLNGVTLNSTQLTQLLALLSQ